MADKRISDARQAAGRHMATNCPDCRAGWVSCPEVSRLVKAIESAEQAALEDALCAVNGERCELVAAVSPDGRITLRGNNAALAALYEAARGLLIDAESLGTGTWRDSAPWLNVERLTTKA